MLRCELPDTPGSLAALAGAIGEAGGDIQAVDVVETGDELVLDDLVVVVEAQQGAHLLEAVQRLPGVRLVHAGPSRGHPGDAVTRLAVGLEALLTGQAPLERGLPTLIGGLLRASAAELTLRDAAPSPSSKVLVLDIDHRVLVLRRDYRFTATERDRAGALVRLAMLSSGAGSSVG